MRLDSDTCVYLTGGTGFVGSHLREALAKRGVSVTLLVREDRPVEVRGTERVQRGDVTVPETLTLADHDVVIHLAAQTSVDMAIKSPAQTWNVNADGTANILEGARKANVRRFLYASTASVYGPPTYLPIDESHPTNPVEPYGASKLAGDGLSRSYASSYDLETVVARVFNTFGPGQPDHNVIPAIVSQALTSNQVELGNLSPSRDFIYIDDVVAGLSSILCEGESGAAYNIGRGNSISVGDMAEMVVDIVGDDTEIVSATERQRSENVEIPNHVADISKISRLGWTPECDLREGIREMVNQLSK